MSSGRRDHTRIAQVDSATASQRLQYKVSGMRMNLSRELTCRHDPPPITLNAPLCKGVGMRTVRSYAAPAWRETPMTAPSGSMDYTNFRNTLCTLAPLANAHGEAAAEAALIREVASLTEQRNALTPEQEALAVKEFRQSCHSLLLQSEFGYYTFVRPRGYPGDYVTQEMMWLGRTAGVEHRYRGVTNLGKLLTAFTYNMAAPRANEARIRKIRALLAQGKFASVASIGCGSCIELWDSASMPVNSLFFLDQDKDALDKARIQLASTAADCTFCEENVVKFILRNQRCLHLGSRDLVYSLGLLDYFPTDTARKIAASLWMSVAPGGTLLITNAHADNPTRLWMEWVSDWILIYKSKAEMLSIVDGLPDVAEVQYELDDMRVYQYVTVRRR